MKQDGVILNTGKVGDPQWADCNSITTVTYMKIGSKVWVEAGEMSETSVAEAKHSFTGVLINDFQP